MRKWKYLLAALVLLILSGVFYGYYRYTKQPADLHGVSADINIDAQKLVADFSLDEEGANQQYTDKVIAVTGIVGAVVSDGSGQITVFLETTDPLSGVSCSFYADDAASARALKKGMSVTIKGKCTGKLSDVILNKCSIQP